MNLLVMTPGKTPDEYQEDVKSYDPYSDDEVLNLYVRCVRVGGTDPDLDRNNPPPLPCKSFRARSWFLVLFPTAPYWVESDFRPS